MLNFLNDKSTATGDLTAINMLSKGTSISGNITSTGDIRIDGLLVGNITTPNKIVTGRDSEIKGDIRIGSGKIGGLVFGNIFSAGTLEIEKTARIEGTIESNGLIIQEGAVIKADIISKNKTQSRTLDNQSKNKTADFSRAAVL
jgi:cytoskeletal protein CcmA (bactofilin family)